MKRPRTTVLFALGLGLAIQAAPAAAWMQWYSQHIPYAPMPGMWFYQHIPGIPSFSPGQAWLWQYQLPAAGLGSPQLQQYPYTPSGPTTTWYSTTSTSGITLEQNETPAGYMIRLLTASTGVPAVDITAQGGFLIIRSGSAAGAGGDMPIRQTGWTTQWISLPVDADIATTRMQQGNGIIEIFIPRRSKRFGS